MKFSVKTLCSSFSGQCLRYCLTVVGSIKIRMNYFLCLALVRRESTVEIGEFLCLPWREIKTHTKHWFYPDCICKQCMKQWNLIYFTILIFFSCDHKFFYIIFWWWCSTTLQPKTGGIKMHRILKIHIHFFKLSQL